MVAFSIKIDRTETYITYLFPWFPLGVVLVTFNQSLFQLEVDQEVSFEEGRKNLVYYGLFAKKKLRSVCLYLTNMVPAVQKAKVFFFMQTYEEFSQVPELR